MIEKSLAEVMDKLADENIQRVLTANHLVVKDKETVKYFGSREGLR